MLSHILLSTLIALLLSLISPCLPSFTFVQISRDSDLMPELVLQALKVANLLTVSAMADSEQKDIAQAITGPLSSDRARACSEWMHSVATNIQVNYDGTVPSLKNELMGLNGNVTAIVANQVLRVGFGFNTGLSLDLDCRKMVVALNLIDLTEVRKNDGTIPMGSVTADVCERSLSTWMDPEDRRDFHIIIKSFVHWAFRNTRRKDSKKRLECLTRKHFTESDSEIVRSMIRDACLYFKDFDRAQEMVAMFSSK